MFDIGWTEMLMIAVVVVVIVGPRDLPKVLRTTGRWVSRARSVAHDFHRSLDQIAEEVELQDIKKDVESATNLGIEKTVLQSKEGKNQSTNNSEHKEKKVSVGSSNTISSGSEMLPKSSIDNRDEGSLYPSKSNKKQTPGD